MVRLATSAELLLRQKTMALSRFFFMLTKASLWKWKSFGSTFRSHSRNRGLKSAGPSTLSINFSGLLICRQIGKVRPSTQLAQLFQRELVRRLHPSGRQFVHVGERCRNSAISQCGAPALVPTLKRAQITNSARINRRTVDFPA